MTGKQVADLALMANSKTSEHRLLGTMAGSLTGATRELYAAESTIDPQLELCDC